MANGLLPQPTDPELQEILSSAEGAKPAFEQLILAAIVLDRSGHRGESRAALRAAADWLDLDERRHLLARQFDLEAAARLEGARLG